ncbi:MAG: (Fe-S)-binding protein [Planctomycetota bacterium]|nr:(Fe-S)-binding protein [Planctomycetota bacterium]
MKLNFTSIPALKDCVHCGLCLPECPTYLATGREAESPRGRIAALRAVAENRSEISAAIHDGLESCLVCRACESACPSGISMEQLMASYRQQCRQERSDLPARVESWLLREVIPHPRRLSALVGGLRWIAPWLRRLPFAREIPSAHRLRPAPEIPEVMEAMGSCRGTVSLLRGCVADRIFRAETQLSARLLAEAGWKVVIPSAGCCGALHHHAGMIEESTDYRRQRWRELAADGVDHVVIESAGCAAHLNSTSSQPTGFVTDTATLLARGGNFTIQQKLPGRSVLSLACHQQHSSLDFDDGTELLKNCLEEQIQLPAPDHCCGAAGMYMVRRQELSRSIGEVARDRFVSSQADQIISGNPGCMLRWESLLGTQKVISPVRLLAHAGGLESL